ncbi:MAG: glycoside hydrolase family 44 protein [Fibrobacteria bacterium]
MRFAKIRFSVSLTFPLAVAVALAASAFAAASAHAEVAVAFQIDLGKDNHAISPLIFGSNTDSLKAEDGVTFRRMGGNRLTGYNWETNASSAGTDWQNSSDNFMGGGSVPGKAMTTFHDAAVGAGAATLITLPAAGYVSKDKKGTVDSVDTAPSARWCKVVFEKGKPFTQTPDSTDGEVYADEFVDFLVKKYGGSAAANGVKNYSVDNEPALWPYTHPRIHPLQPTAVELVQKTRDLSLAVKKVDPGARIFGGVFYGYAAYNNFQSAPDWNTVNAGNKYGWYIDYFLDQMKLESDKAGKRLMDVLDIHWYPEATGDNRIVAGNATTAADRAARLQAPRSLWDSGYVENSWISKSATPRPGTGNPGPINLLPRILASIAKYNPGTKLAITEYHYGEGDHISGGLAQADFLGICAKMDVYAASFWPLDGKLSYVKAAFRLFRNYDGNKGLFGSISAAATASDNQNASVFASYVPAGDEVHIIALNKNTAEPVRGTFTVTSPVALTQGKVFGFDGTATTLSEKAAVATVTGNVFTYVLPPLSASHFVIKTAAVLPSVSILSNPSGLRGAAKADAGLPAYLPDGRRLPNQGSAESAAPLFRLPRR